MTDAKSALREVDQCPMVDEGDWGRCAHPKGHAGPHSFDRPVATPSSKTEVDDVQWKDGVPYVRGLMLNYDELAAYAFRLREFKASAAEPAGDEFHQLWQMLADDCNATPCEWFQLRDGLHRWLRTKGKESALKTSGDPA